MPYPQALFSSNQPLVCQLCEEAVWFTRQITARNPGPANELNQRVQQLFALTGDASLNDYLQGAPDYSLLSPQVIAGAQ